MASDAESEHEETTEDFAKKRVADSKLLTDKEAAKADAEATFCGTTEGQTSNV